MFFWNSLALSMIQRMLAIWSLVPLPFLKPAWTSGTSLNPKKMAMQKCSYYPTVVLIWHAIKVKHKILQARLQQFMNHELPDVQGGFREGRGTRDQIANICSTIEKAREFQKNIYFCFIDHAKAFDCVDHSKLWKIFQEMGIADHLTCPLRNVCSSSSNS